MTPKNLKEFKLRARRYRDNWKRKAEECKARVAALEAELAALKLPEGCTGTDVRVLREANGRFAAENEKLRAKLRAMRPWAKARKYSKG